LKTLRVLIVDDEVLARRRLEDLLQATDGVSLAGTADNGDSAIAAIRTLAPDLVFLDVQMPGKNGLEVVREIGPKHMPPIIFVTAYDQYAINAFDLAALDYLVKPFDDERFEQALARARELIQLRDLGRLSDRLAGLLQPQERPAQPAWLERIAVEMRGQVRVVPVEEIDYVTASGPYVELHTRDRTHLIRERMQVLEERLDPAKFFRIHRSAIVRLEQVETLLRDSGGDYAVRLKTGVQLSVSRNRIEALEKWMGLAR
jgi:two-component system, LytTR family, response regulator